jgi:hypothetical protein
VVEEEPEPEEETREEEEATEETAEEEVEEEEWNGVDYGYGRTDTPWMYYHSTFALIGMAPVPVFIHDSLNAWQEPYPNPVCSFSFSVDIDDPSYSNLGGSDKGYCAIFENDSLTLAYAVGGGPYAVAHEYTDSFGWGEYEPMAV